MPGIEQLPLWVRAYLAAYAWRRVDPLPAARLPRPVAGCRVALVTSGALVPPGAIPFDKDRKGGDTSFRLVAGEANVQACTEHHRSWAFDHAGIEQDRNLALPLEALKLLAARGEIGAVAPRHLSFMGSITAPGRLIAETAPEAAALLCDDGVEVALLVPV